MDQLIGASLSQTYEVGMLKVPADVSDWYGVHSTMRSNARNTQMFSVSANIELLGVPHPASSKPVFYALPCANAKCFECLSQCEPKYSAQ